MTMDSFWLEKTGHGVPEQRCYYFLIKKEEGGRFSIIDYSGVTFLAKTEGELHCKI